MVKNEINRNKIRRKGLHGIGIAGVRAISRDHFENIYIAGFFAANILIDNVVFNSTTVSNSDIYIAKFSSTKTLICSKQFGRTGNDYARGIDVDASDNIYFPVVLSNSIDFDGLILIADDLSDFFLKKLIMSEISFGEKNRK